MSEFNIKNDIKPLISAAITGITADQIGSEWPEDQNNCIAIFEDGGKDPIHTMGDQKPAMIQPDFVIMMRHESKVTMASWWNDIKAALDGKTNYTIDGRVYMSIMQDGDLTRSIRDTSRRHLQGLKFNTMIENAY